MIKRRNFFLLTIALAPLLSGCLASFQTARTMPEGASRFYVGAEYQATDGSLTSTGAASSSTTTTLTTNQRTTLDIGGRFGLSRKWDLGVRVSLPTLNFSFPNLLADLRYQLVLSGGFAMSLGLGVDYVSPDLVIARGHVLSLVPALNFGYDFNKYFGLYLSARDLTPAILALGALNATFVTGSVIAGSFGFRVGDEYGILAEGTYLKYLATGGGNGFMIGLAFVFGNGAGIPISGETNRRAENWKERQAEMAPHERVSSHARVMRGVSKILKVRASGNIALLSQPEVAPWKLSDRVCIFKNSQSVACGVITKSDATGAVLKYTDANGPVIPGMEASAEGGETKARSRSAPAESPETADELPDPAIDELP